MTPLGFDFVPTADRYGIEGSFIRPQFDGDYPIWGVRDGIVLGIPPARIGLGRDDCGGPRGLIRIGYEGSEGLRFINFLAISPITGNGRRGMSELDHSPTDGKQGIIMQTYPLGFHNRYDDWADRSPPAFHEAAKVRRVGEGRELVLVIRYEAFANGARPYFVVSFRADRPREVVFSFHEEPGARPMKTNVLSSTFGNLTRQRLLFLRNRVLDARRIWPNYRADGFAPMQLYSLKQLRRNSAGDVVFAAGPDEQRPYDQPGYPHPRVLTQYFRKPRGDFDNSLHGLVNGRYVYWKTNYPVPGGISFENVGLMEDFRPGRVQIFGYHEGDPERLFD